MRTLEDSLGIFIITFNRAARLERTLERLASGPFARCTITILDNHSDDGTPAVCARYAESFERLRIVRHRVNIGLSANYLRAVEHAVLPYTWVLGDDDELDTTDVSDIVHAVRRDDLDLIIVGAVNQPAWALGEATTARALYDRGFPYFYVTGWITGVIFRTDLFQSEDVHLGYKNADNVFPHFPFFARCLERNVSVYLARNWIAGGREPEGYGRLGSEMLAGWIASARYIEDPAVRRIAILHGPIGQGQPASLRHATVLFFKAFGVHNVVRRNTILATWTKCFVVASWDLRLTLVPSLLHVICPEPVARAGWRLLQRMRGKASRRIEDYASELDEART